MIKSLFISIILFLFSYRIYTIHDNFYPSTDTLPNTYTAINFYCKNNLSLDPFRSFIYDHGIEGIGVLSNANKLYAKTPVINGIIASPFIEIQNKILGIDCSKAIASINNNSRVQEILSKNFGAFTAAFSVGLLFLVLEGPFLKKLILVLTYAFATQVYSVASQANWQHGPSLLLLVTILFLIKKNNRINKILLGLICSLAFLIRPSNIIFILAYQFSNLITKKKVDIFSLVPFILSYVLYQHFVISPLNIPGGYNNEIFYSFSIFNYINTIKVFISILFSTNMGLFVYSPVLIFALFGLQKNSIKKIKLLTIFSLVSISLFLLLNSIWWAWPGGLVWGPRMLLEATPMLIYLISKQSFTPIKIVFFTILLSISLSIQIIGVYMNDLDWNTVHAPGNKFTLFEKAWKTNPSQILYYLVEKRAIHINKLYTNNDMLNTKVYNINFRTLKLTLVDDQKHYFTK